MYAKLHYFMSIRWNSSSEHVRRLALSSILNLCTRSQLGFQLHDSLHDSEIQSSVVVRTGTSSAVVVRTGAIYTSTTVVVVRTGTTY